MMTFEYEGEKYTIDFEYAWAGSRCTDTPVRVTKCYINRHVPGCDVPYMASFGHATQHVKDQFCKRTGRKLALRIAVKRFMDEHVKYKHGTKPNKMIRKRIWDAYFEQCDKDMLPVNKKELKEKRYEQKSLKEAATWT